MNTQLTATAVALAFNSATERKSWKARANSRPTAGLDLVHFNSTGGLISLVYNTMDGQFHVKFNKFQASWGDYVKGIANGLYYVLSTLKEAGLPFDAPDDPEGIEIVSTNTAGTDVNVRWQPDAPLPEPDAPESVSDAAEEDI